MPPEARLPTPIKLSLLAVIALTVVLYLPSLGNALLFDDSILLNGQIFSEFGGLTALRPRMLSYGSFTWVQALVPDQWWFQRAINVALHAVIIVLMYLFYAQLLRALGLWDDPVDAATQLPGSVPAAHWALLAGVAWFALQPMSVYAVAYMVQRSIVMALLFSLLSLWAVLQALTTQQRRFWLLAALAYVAAMLSKEYALALPALGAGLVVLVKRPSAKHVSMFAVGVAMLGAAAAYLLYTRYSAIIGKPFDETSIAYVKQMDLRAPGVEKLAYPLSILNQAWLFFEYGCRWFLPSTSMMSIDMRPPFPASLTSTPHVLGVMGYLSLLAASIVLMLRYRGRLALLGFCLFAPVVLFVTEFSSVWIQDPFVLYRSYLWALAVPGVIFLLASQLSRQALIGAAVAVGALFFWQSTDRIQSFRDEFTVWNDAVEKLPRELVIGKSRPYLNRGQAYQLRGENTRALRDYERSTAFGDGGEGLLNTGALLLTGGRAQEALAAFDAAAMRGQVSASLSLNRGTALATLGQTQAAYDAFSKGLTLYPDPQESAALKRQRATAALRLGRIDDALADAQAAALVFAQDPQIRVTLGYAWLAKGNRDAGIAAFNDSINKSPNPAAYFGLARVYASASRLPEARAAVAKALAMQPENVEFQQLSAKLAAGG
jgi:protein O-mannosyl-transferase